MLKLLIATSNKGKVKEYFQMLKGLPYELVDLTTIGINNTIKENYSTYDENALYKAVSYNAISGLITLADDSGLEVDALKGEPGVLSARYAGEGASDEDRILYLLAKIKNVPWEKRTAKFKCVIAVALDTKRTELFYGECTGLITFEPRGNNGFGYDPVFYLPELEKTMAELPPSMKNRISHRGRAVEKAYKWLESLTERPVQ